MLLRNFIALTCMYPDNTNLYYKGMDAKGDAIGLNYVGHLITKTVSGAIYNETGITLNNTAYYTGIVVGTGSTAPTYNDYKMQSAIEPSSVSYSNNSLLLPNGGGNANITDPMIATFTQQVTNTSNSNITITEVGLFKGTNSTNCASLLMTRDIITPVTIAPGETKTFVVTIDFAQMSTSASAS